MSWVANMLLICWDDDDQVESLSDWLRQECPWRSESGTAGTGVGYLSSLTPGWQPEQAWTRFVRRLRRRKRARPTQWGGWKYPECDVWAAALNHADLNAVVTKVAGLAWRHPESVQLLLQDQEQDYFRMWMYRGGEFRQLVPAGDSPTANDD